MIIITRYERKDIADKKMVGLTASEVIRSRAKYGNNSLSREKKKSFWRRFVSNLGDPVIKILIGALIINLIFTFRRSDPLETVGIAVSIFMATMISTLSEHGSQAAFERLEAESGKQKFRVFRDGAFTEIDIDGIVVGDLVSVGAGEQIPADGRIVSGELVCDQSAMTGESKEVRKMPSEDCDRTPSSKSYCLRGCTVLSGDGIIEIDTVGDSTFLGGISKEIQSETRDSPLKIRLTKLAKQISVFGYTAAILIALVYLFNIFVADSAFDTDIIKYKLSNVDFLLSHLFHALTLGLTVVVMSVPEGLPLMVSVVLSGNNKKMVKDNVLVRKPVGIEAAGSMNILFTDKTGTLTEGKMGVGQIILGDGCTFNSVNSLPNKIKEKYIVSALGNSSASVGVSNGKRSAIGGNSTERAIINSVIKKTGRFPDVGIVKKLPFDSKRKFSAALVRHSGELTLFVKGAPEKLFPYVHSCIDRNGDQRGLSVSKIEEICRDMARKGKRVLLIAEAMHTDIECVGRGIFGELNLLCIVSLEDRIRREAQSSVNQLRRAGIHVVMITGDSKDTAAFIASQCGILGGGVDLVLTGGELSEMSDAKIKEILPRLGVLSRALPADKSRLVRLSQELDLVTGMTGDGVNDAPALKLSDVGFAMGSGTQVAKEAGDVVILDNNLSSIAKAVLYGRNIFKSIRKFISLQLIMNLCAVGVSMICPFIGYDAPVTVVQMLWINIIMDTLGGLAFAGEPALRSYMEEKPKRRDEPILNGYMIYEIIFGGGFTIALCIAFLKMPEVTSRFRAAEDNIYLLTAFFALFIFASVFNCFCARSDRLSLFAHITKNRGFIAIMAVILGIQILFVYLGGTVLRTAPLTFREISVTFFMALLVFPADFIKKLIWRMLCGKKGY